MSRPITNDQIHHTRREARAAAHPSSVPVITLSSALPIMMQNRPQETFAPLAPPQQTVVSMTPQQRKRRLISTLQAASALANDTDEDIESEIAPTNEPQHQNLQ